MSFQSAIEDALAGKIIARVERCPWELVDAAREYKSSYLFRDMVVPRFRAMLEKYADKLSDWLED